MGPRTRGLRALATVALLLLLAATLGGCGRVPDGRAPATRLTLVAADGQRLDATATALGERPAIPEATARTQAALVLPVSGQATSVQARFVALTLGTEGTARHVWLITYIGAPFVPTGCTCHVDGTTANTVVAIDGQKGMPTMVFGIDEERHEP